MEETKNADVDIPMETAMDSDMEEPDIDLRVSPPVQKRSRLLVLMGFPNNVDGTDKYEVEDDGDDEEEDGRKGRRAKWRKVLNRLKSNPEEASICEGTHFPLDDALWVQTNPVPPDVFIRLLRTFPKAFTAQTYEIACNNPNTRPRVMKLLRGADINGDIVEERTELIKHMGYPKHKFDDSYCPTSVKPNWDAVRGRLVTHPGEAKIDEDGCFPLADALWIKSDPAPVDIIKTLIEIHPEALTDHAFQVAGHPKTRPEVLQLMFSIDMKPNAPVIPSTSEDSYVKVD